LTIDKDLERVSAGEIGFSIEDGKAIMGQCQTNFPSGLGLSKIRTCLTCSAASRVHRRSSASR
jgi:hypothetical protein